MKILGGVYVGETTWLPSRVITFCGMLQKLGLLSWVPFYILNFIMVPFDGVAGKSQRPVNELLYVTFRRRKWLCVCLFYRWNILLSLDHPCWCLCWDHTWSQRRRLRVILHYLNFLSLEYITYQPYVIFNKNKKIVRKKRLRGQWRKLKDISFLSSNRSFLSLTLVASMMDHILIYHFYKSYGILTRLASSS